MSSTRFNPEGPTVFVVGAGFSAELGFPLAAHLLPSLGDRLPVAERRLLDGFLRQQYPRFDADDPASYPTAEELLTKLMALEQQSSLASKDGTTPCEPRDLRRLLMAGIGRWFMGRQQTIMQSPPGWLERLREWVVNHQPTFIAFNWDLVLDQLLYGSTLSPQAYGFGLPAHVPALLKPHGSLNWYASDDATLGRQDRDAFRIGAGPADRLVAYRNLGASSFPPRGPHMPAIFPEAFLRTVDTALFRELDRACVERISQARHLVFLGYPMPETDLHARSLFASALSERGSAPLSIRVVNRDKRAGLRTSALLGRSASVEQECCSTMDWISSNL